MSTFFRAIQARTSRVEGQSPTTRATYSYVLLLVLACVFVAPFIWLLLTALKADGEIDAYHVIWLPAHAYWSNFLTALQTPGFVQGAINSVILSVIYVPLVTITSALVGFGFARLRGPGKNQLFLVMLATLMMPQIITLIPIYFIYSRLGFVGTYWPWVLAGLASAPFLAFLFRQFFSAIPEELEEAAIIDGCGYARIFWQIFLPLAKPALAAAALLSFTSVWGDFVMPLLFLNQDNTTLSVVLAYGFNGPHGEPSIVLVAAGSLLYILPVMIVFFFGQRYFVQGVVTSGIKG